MGWNKNTIRSNFDDMVNLMSELGHFVEITMLGKVMGMGLNDNEDTWYPIRKAVCMPPDSIGIVLMEQMQRSLDCDCDDMIICHRFTTNTAPSAWDVEITLDEDIV